MAKPQFVNIDSFTETQRQQAGWIKSGKFSRMNDPGMEAAIEKHRSNCRLAIVALANGIQLYRN